MARRSEIGSGMGIDATKEKRRAEATGASLKSLLSLFLDFHLGSESSTTIFFNFHGIVQLPLSFLRPWKTFLIRASSPVHATKFPTLLSSSVLRVLQPYQPFVKFYLIVVADRETIMLVACENTFPYS